MTVLQPTRRGIIGGLGVLFAAPTIVRASSLMQVKVIGPVVSERDFLLRQLERQINPPLLVSREWVEAYDRATAEAFSDLAIFGTGRVFIPKVGLPRVHRA